MTPPYPTKDASPGLWPLFSWGFGEPCRRRFPACPRLGGGEFDRVAVEPVANSRVGRADHSGPHGREAKSTRQGGKDGTQIHHLRRIPERNELYDRSEERRVGKECRSWWS